MNIGIEIDEILRAKAYQFNRYYLSEFGESGSPDNYYVFDFFNEYKFNDNEEKIIELNDNIPDDLNILDYQNIDDSNNKLFKEPIITNLTSKEVFNKFLYEDYCSEIFGFAPLMYRNLDLDFKNLILKYDNINDVNFYIYSIENHFSIPPTLFFLSKLTSRVRNIIFIDDVNLIVDKMDIIITTNPNLLNNKDINSKLIKVNREYNKSINNEFLLEINQISDLLNNVKFDKIINKIYE